MTDLKYEELVKATENFSPSTLIGKGRHGLVYKGVIEEAKQLVAIKTLSSSKHDILVLQDNSKKLDNEIRVLSSLPQSPHIINFLGASHDSATNHKLLVMEFMPNGSLHDSLHVDSIPPPWPQRLQITLQLAGAFQFLHQGKPLIIHRYIMSFS